MSERAEVLVVGLGPGGEEVAHRLARAGLDVIGIDGGLVGGECPYWGCVPSKMMIRAANLLAEARRIPGMAGDATVRPDWGPVARRIREDATDNWNDARAVKRLEQSGARFRRGWAKVLGPRQVSIGDETFEATRGLVLDTGGAPWVPPIPGISDLAYWTNRQAIEAETVPQSLLVLGGGAIGAELAQVFARFESAVTVVEAGPRILALEEPEAGELVGTIFEREGIVVRAGAEIASASSGGDGFVLSLGAAGEVTGERLLVATGRRPDLAALGVAALGLDETARSIPVDDRMRVTDGVWAIGDSVGHGAFTHMSMYEAEVVIADVLGERDLRAQFHAVPRVTFTDPEVGSVGLSEADARKLRVDVATGFTDLTTSTRGWIHKAGNEGFIKLVADRARQVLVGATSVGPSGGEVLGLLTLAVHEAVPVGDLERMIYAYPTFHRAIIDALKDLRSNS